MLTMRHLFFLACAVPAIGFCQAGASAEVRLGRGPVQRPFVGHPGPGVPNIGPVRSFAGLRNRGFGRPPGLAQGQQPNQPGQQFAHGGPRGADLGRGGRQGHGFPHGPMHGGQHGLQHGMQHMPGGTGRPPLRNLQPAVNILARNGLPHRPLPGEAGFTGVPPRGETRFVSNEMVVHVGSEVSPQALDAAARRLGLTAIGVQNLTFSGGRLVHFRVSRGEVADLVRTLETERIGIAQPNYVFELQQDVRVAALPPPKGDPAQYVIDKLHLHDAHTLASGANVTVAVIDSLIDAGHPDLTGSIAGQFDAVGAADRPDEHGTGMTGAIAAHRRLLGVAPQARILAIHAFSPDARHPQQATTQSIVAGIDWAISKGARVINMSFAGPYDPLLQLALKKARDKGVVLIAAAGNMGPQSPPLYPAADENVVAVTSVDEKDKLMSQANQGTYVALAAPGVNVLEAAPRASYNFTTGTSVAAAHVSGVAALLLERYPGIDPATLEDALFSTARDLGATGRDPMFGYGLVDPYRALNALESRAIARTRSVPETTASANPGQVAGATAKPPPGAAGLVSGAPAGPIGPATPRVSVVTPAGEVTVGGGTGEVTASRPPPATPAALPHSTAEGDETALIERKRQVCRQAGADQGVQASDMADYVAVCVGEARLACLKQAVALKVHGPERRDFMNRCLQGS
jgi:Subtilase family